jgi:hypothetical protein
MVVSGTGGSRELDAEHAREGDAVDAVVEHELRAAMDPDPADRPTIA